MVALGKQCALTSIKFAVLSSLKKYVAIDIPVKGDKACYKTRGTGIASDATGEGMNTQTKT